MPTLTGSPTRSRTARRRRTAISTGVPAIASMPRTSRNASSIDRPSTRGVVSSKTAYSVLARLRVGRHPGRDDDRLGAEPARLAGRPSPCGRRRPSPRSSPRARHRRRRSRGGRAGGDRRAARPTRRTSPRRRAGSSPRPARTHVRTLPGYSVRASLIRLGPSTRTMRRPLTLACSRQAALGVPDRPDRRPDRRVRGGCRHGTRLRPRRLPAAPERHPAARAGGPRRSGEPGGVRRSPRAAQRPARAASRLAGRAPRNRGAPAGRGRRPPRRPVSARPRADRLRRGRPARNAERREARRRAGARETARGAVPRQRELRHGADARLCRRDTRGRLGHRRLPAARLGGLRPARPPGDERHLAEAIVSLLADEPRRRGHARAARELALRYGWPALARRLRTIYERLVDAPGVASASASRPALPAPGIASRA